MITRESEKKYRSHTSPNTPLPLTRLSDPSSVDLTIVVPAYNETERLPIMMASTIDHLTSPNLSGKRTFEILVVDDGSTDGTSATALQLAAKYPKCNIRVVTLEKNVGKGGAVRHGMLYASGERLLMADADGASRIEDLEHLWKAMDKLVPDNGPAVVVGSRAHLVKSEAVVKVCICHGHFYVLLVLNIAFLALLHSQHSHVWPTHYSANCRCWTHS
jgi:dolichyl-phosphate beta-glucosyltransferase